MKIKMQVMRVTTEYSQILEIEVPSNDDYEAQFIVESMSRQDLLKFETVEYYEETDYSDNYLIDLEYKSSESLTMQITSVVPIHINQRKENISAMDESMSMSHEEWTNLSELEIANIYMNFRTSKAFINNPKDTTIFVVVE